MSSNLQANIAFSGKTAFSQYGEGKTIVLVHGLGLNQHMWQWQVESLSQHYHVITYDLLGHGNSPKPQMAYTMQHMIDQLHNLMADLGEQSYGLIGFSLGGLIVQAYTLAYPEQVSALAILNAAHGRTDEQRAGILKRVEQCREHGPTSTVDDALLRWFSEKFAAQHPEVLGQVRQWVMANDPAVYPELYQLLAYGDVGLESRIATIQCPTLVLTGDEDYGNSAEMAQRMAELIPNSQLSILSGLRHMALAEDPEQFNGVLLEFFKSSY